MVLSHDYKLSIPATKRLVDLKTKINAHTYSTELRKRGKTVISNLPLNDLWTSFNSHLTSLACQTLYLTASLGNGLGTDVGFSGFLQECTQSQSDCTYHMTNWIVEDLERLGGIISLTPNLFVSVCSYSRTILDYNPYSLPRLEGEASVLGRECS